MCVIVEIIVDPRSLFIVRIFLQLQTECWSELTVSRTKRNARVHVDNCTSTASKYAN